MGYIQIGIIIILFLVVLFLLVDIHFYRRNIKSFQKQLFKIMREDTNAIVRVDIPQKDIIALSDVINQLIKRNRETLVAAERLDQSFRESITNVSHDLRTPLTTAGGYLGMIKDPDLSQEERLEYIEIIEERQDMVRKLLDQLFYYARMEAGKDFWHEKRIDIHKLLLEILAMYYNDFEVKEIEPEIQITDCKMMVWGDEDGMRRIFSNIISNGLAHGNGAYQVKLLPVENGFEFSFSNASESMEKEELLLIFQRFYCKDTSRTGKSTGLGLAIAKELVERMQGRIWAEYENGVFSIRVFLPEEKMKNTKPVAF